MVKSHAGDTASELESPSLYRDGINFFGALYSRAAAGKADKLAMEVGCRFDGNTISQKSEVQFSVFIADKNGSDYRKTKSLRLGPSANPEEEDCYEIKLDRYQRFCDDKLGKDGFITIVITFEDVTPKYD